MILGPVGFAVGELQQLTTITHLNETLKHYRNGELVDDRAPAKVSWILAPQVNRGQVGMGLGLSF